MTTADRKQRLQRLERILIWSPIYFVTTCTNERRPILAAESVHRAFVQFAQEGIHRGAWLGAYVLMPDHLHLFVGFDDRKIELSRWMKSLKNTLSKTLGSDGVRGSHWQKGFFDHVLRSEESYEQKWHYVRENPVRHGLVGNWQDWPFRGEILDLRYYSD